MTLFSSLSPANEYGALFSVLRITPLYVNTTDPTPVVGDGVATMFNKDPTVERLITSSFVRGAIGRSVAALKRVRVILIDTGGETGGELGGDTGCETGGDTGFTTGGRIGGVTGFPTGGGSGGVTGDENGEATGGATGVATGGATGGETGVAATGGGTGRANGGTDIFTVPSP